MKKISTLEQIGERNIINNIIMERFHNIKAQDDDCAIVEIGNETLLLTTDPAPEPIAFQLGFHDYYYYGWLTVIVNLSDLASMGAVPLGVLTATVMNPDMQVSEYEKFLQGVEDACQEYDCLLLGGNIKDGSVFSSNGFAIGSKCSHGKVLRQSKAEPGDAICVIGSMGNFWASVIWYMEKWSDFIISDSEKEYLFQALTRPTAKVKEGVFLSHSEGITSCTDNSDGITWSLINMARKASGNFILDMSYLRPSNLLLRIASRGSYPFENLLLSGGGYQLICTIKTDYVEQIKCQIEKMGTHFYQIGYVDDGCGLALVKDNNTYYNLNDLSSERFQKHSMFTHGYKEYLQMMKTSDIRGTVYTQF
ncbi:thiamine-phosphate kinase [Lachnospiraceae bacterium 54-11]